SPGRRWRTTIGLSRSSAALLLQSPVSEFQGESDAAGAAARPTRDNPTETPADPSPDESRDDRLARLLKKARALPTTPGVYLMKDAAGVVLYVGKAARLRDRASSYFVPSAVIGALTGHILDLVRYSETT